MRENAYIHIKINTQPVQGELISYILAVVHHTAIIVWDTIAVDIGGAVLLKVVLHSLLDILGQNSHELVSIRTSLLMLKPYSMAQFMDYDTFL